MMATCAADVWELADEVMKVAIIIGVWGVCESILPDKSDRWALLLVAGAYFLMTGVPTRRRSLEFEEAETGPPPAAKSR